MTPTPRSTFLEFVSDNLAGSPYQPYVCEGLEWQFQPTDDEHELDQYGSSSEQPYKYRIPRDGRTKPTANDRPIGYHPRLIKCFGTSWWNWRAAQTIGCMVDVDFGHGASARTLEEIAEWDRQAARCPYLLNVTSKSGQGRHGVVFLENPLPAKTRGQHQANCRRIVAQLCADLGIKPDFFCQRGGIQFIFHRGQAKNGFQLVSAPTCKLVLPDKVEADPFENADEAQRRVLSTELMAHPAAFDEIHKSIGKTVCSDNWPWEVEEYDGKILIRTHTKGLAFDHAKNARKGLFKTNSPGTDRHKPNCYAFLKPGGGLAVRCFGNGAEADTWHQGPSGIWCCDYNAVPVFGKACELCGGHRGKEGVVKFVNGRAGEVLTLLGVRFKIPEPLQKMRTDLQQEGTHLQISIHAAHCGDFDGLTFAYGKYETTIEDCLAVAEVPTYDCRIRHTTKMLKGRDWLFLDGRGNWIAESLNTIKTYLKGFGHNDYLVAEIVQRHLDRNWKLTHIPFGKEYPGELVWNREAARYKCQPQKGDWSNCKMIADHCGAALTPYILKNEWCITNGISTGGQYLLLWAALAFRQPELRLPYLFFWSEAQNSGKSSFHRMLVTLFADKYGWAEFRKELLKDDFNDLMRGCVVAYLEEIDLSQSPTAYHLVKGLVDSPYLKLRCIYDPSEMETNYVHFIHSANHRHHCPIYPNDTRIMVIPVARYEGRDIPWVKELQPLVDKETPAILHELLTMPIPEQGVGRLFLPLIDTPDREEAMAERAAELAGWYDQFRELAATEMIVNLEAKDILQMLIGSTSDPKLPKNGAGLGSRLQTYKDRLAKDGFDLSWNGEPARYTVKPLPDKEHP